MEIMKAILNRRSYRGQYTSESVPREHLVQIMEAGLIAPSGCNKQTTSLIAVDDEQVLAQLHAVIDPPVGASAPAMICVLSREMATHRGKSYHVQDYAAAIENMLLVIESLGYASCWVEGYVTGEERIGRKMADILGVPQDVELVCYLPVGRAAGKPNPRTKLPFEERAWFNGYRRTE